MGGWADGGSPACRRRPHAGSTLQQQAHQPPAPHCTAPTHHTHLNVLAPRQAGQLGPRHQLHSRAAHARSAAWRRHHAGIVKDAARGRGRGGLGVGSGGVVRVAVWGWNARAAAGCVQLGPPKQQRLPVKELLLGQMPTRYSIYPLPTNPTNRPHYANPHLMRLDTPAVANSAPSRSNSREEMMEEAPGRSEGRGISATGCRGEKRGGGQRRRLGDSGRVQWMAAESRELWPGPPACQPAALAAAALPRTRTSTHHPP